MRRFVAATLLTLGLTDLAWINYRLHPQHWLGLTGELAKPAQDLNRFADSTTAAPKVREASLLPADHGSANPQPGTAGPAKAPSAPDFSQVDPAHLLHYRVVGSWHLSPRAQKTLRQIARKAKADPKLWIEVRGHSDQQGEDSENQALSQTRAKGAVEYLVQAGVPASRISIRAMGARQLARPENTPRARYANRRVEIRLRSVTP